MTECCNKPQAKDLTQGLGDDRHWYCASCKSHKFKGRQYTQAEWDRMANSKEILL